VDDNGRSSSTGEDERPRGREVRAIRDTTSRARLALMEPAGRPSRMRDRSGPAVELDGAGALPEGYRQTGFVSGLF
jgi:hypothetical protein